MTYHVVVQFDVPADKHDDFIAHALRDARDSVRDEPGTLSFTVLRDAENPGRFYLDEVYEDQAAFGFHGKQPAFETFIAAVQPFITGRTFLVRANRVTAEVTGEASAS